MRLSKKDGVVLYLAIQNAIRKDIKEGRLKAGDRLPSEAELMSTFSVSRNTASKALNELADSGWIVRIQGNGSFVSKDIGAILESPEHVDSYEIGIRTLEKEECVDQEMMRRVIGFIIPSVRDDYAQQLVYGINERCAELGYSVHIRLTATSRDSVEGTTALLSEKLAIKELLKMGAEGLIIFPTDFPVYDEEILTLKINRYPFVLIDRKLPGVITNYVEGDNVTGAALAVEYLHKMGHERLAFCTDGEMHVSTVADRFASYKRKGDELGLDTDCVFKMVNTAGKEQLMECLRNRQVTAFLAAESPMALYLHEAIISLGMRVPEDFSIITFDNPAPAYPEMEFFTYIDQRPEIMGREAVSVLSSLFEKGSNSDIYQNIKIAPELCERRSVCRLNGKKK